MTLAVPVRKLAVQLVDLRGERSSAVVFLHAVSSRDPRPETLGDRLNAPDARFLPCQIGEKVELVQLAWISYLEVPGTLAEVDALRAVGAHEEDLDLELAHGERVSATMLYEARVGRDRVSDVLNAEGAEFLLFLDGERTLYVRRGAMVRVRARED